MGSEARDRSLGETIARTNATFAAALQDGDPRAASAVYAENATMLAPSAELLSGRQAIAAFWSAGVEAGISGVELTSIELERNSGLAYEIGRYTLSLRSPEGTVVDHGKYLIVHALQADGSWRRAAEMFSPDSPPTLDRGRQDETGTECPRRQEEETR
jgi:uncharacterized protein (TIGR02246 family)